MTYEQFAVVVVPFPFTDMAATKRRPALVLSGAAFNLPLDRSVMAMITTTGHASWPLDVPIKDLANTGLSAPSIVRMKLFTLDHGLVHRQTGTLSATDQQAVLGTLRQLFKIG